MKKKIKRLLTNTLWPETHGRSDNLCICIIFVFFFHVMSCLRCYIDFNMYFFYLYNFDIFMYSYYIHIIFRVTILLYFNYFSYIVFISYNDIIRSNSELGSGLARKVTTSNTIFIANSFINKIASLLL